LTFRSVRAVVAVVTGRWRWGGLMNTLPLAGDWRRLRPPSDEQIGRARRAAT
jgi:hypothetical protein